MGLTLTDHAIERFIARWRPGMPKDEASAELEVIAQGAAPTRKRTLVGDARLYVALSEAGERIAFAVREGVALTVLPGDGEGNDPIDRSVKPEYIEESEATRAACQAILAAEVAERATEAEKERALKLEADRRRTALCLIREWQAGVRVVKPAAVARAYTLLGLNVNDPLPKEEAPPNVSAEVEADRRRSAEMLIKEWKRGRSSFSKKAISNAHKVLGLPYP
jgi:hypothetical protein